MLINKEEYWEVGNHAILGRMQYSEDYEEKDYCQKCHILSLKANNSPFCNTMQLQWEKNFNSTE